MAAVAVEAEDAAAAAGAALPVRRHSEAGLRPLAALPVVEVPLAAGLLSVALRPVVIPDRAARCTTAGPDRPTDRDGQEFIFIRHRARIPIMSRGPEESSDACRRCFSSCFL